LDQYVGYIAHKKCFNNEIDDVFGRNKLTLGDRPLTQTSDF